ncbi:hypothetical protein PN465_00735 [Nodularia spumigena CS-584]|jgi:hypothetical protein|nr:hypothetical protein [Nodularia spumigena]AHJ26927.1 hypothetical protein NSP_5770 [Nodularia spumigena CCY9414]EAW44454.1 hypothetical protein N9414_03673 [Nodularia spumigena CCY9414]MDB9380770.1 hypothetical protein [Nodularia spumigena CS-584]
MIPNVGWASGPSWVIIFTRSTDNFGIFCHLEVHQINIIANKPQHTDLI